MNDYSDYASRTAEKYSALLPATTVPPFAQGGPSFVSRELERVLESVDRARRVVREDSIREWEEVLSQVKLISGTPFGIPIPLQKLVERERRIVLLSDAGAGKTAALRYLVTRVESNGRLAALLNLRDLAAADEVRPAEGSLPDYLVLNARNTLSLELSPEFFQDALVSGDALLCFDGLDEVVEESQRAAAVGQLEAWARQFPRARFVVTARTNAYQPALSDALFAHYTLKPWSENVLDDLGREWNEALDGWVVEGRAARNTFYAERHRLWQDLALAMREHGAAFASLEDAQAWLADEAERDGALKLNKRKARQEAASLLKESLPKLSLVHQENGGIRFVPRLVQDILAAQAIAARCVVGGIQSAWARIEPHLWDLSWREVVAWAFRFLSQEHPALWEELLAYLLDAGGKDPLEPVLRRHLLQSAQALAVSRPSAGSGLVQKRIVDGLASWISESTAAGRKDAVDVFLKLGGYACAVDGAFQLAANGSLDPRAQEAACLLLGQLGQARRGDAAQALQACIEDKEKKDLVRKAAAVALGKLFAGATEEDALRTAVEQKMVAWARDPSLPVDLGGVIVEVLGTWAVESGRTALVDDLIALARGSKEGEVKISYNAQISAARALTALARTAEDEALAARLHDLMWNVVADEGVDAGIRIELAQALGKTAHAQEVAQALLSVAQNAQATYAENKMALDVLGQLGYVDETLVREITVIAESADRKYKDFVRLAAARALDGLGERASSIQHILQLVADKSIYRSTRHDAFTMIGDLGLSGIEPLDQATVAILRVWAKEDRTTEDIQERAMESLTALGVEEEPFVQDLIALLQDQRQYTRVRRAAAKSLGALSARWKEPVCEGLNAVFYNPDEANDPLRVIIARSLLHFGEEEDALKYLKAAADQSYMAAARCESALILGERGLADQAIPPLLKLVQDPQIADNLRQDGMRALGLWGKGNSEVEQGILATLAQPTLEVNVREQAYASLKAVTTV